MVHCSDTYKKPANSQSFHSCHISRSVIMHVCVKDKKKECLCILCACVWLLSPCVVWLDSSPLPSGLLFLSGSQYGFILTHTLARTHAHTASDIHGLAFTQNHTHITGPCGTAVHSHGWPPIIHLYYNITHVERTHTHTYCTHMAKPLAALSYRYSNLQQALLSRIIKTFSVMKCINVSDWGF